MGFRSKSKWYKAQKVQKYALNSQLQALQILTSDDEVENWSLSSFLLPVQNIVFWPKIYLILYPCPGNLTTLVVVSMVKCLWCANYILLRKNLLWYRKSKMHRCWVCSIYVGKCYILKTNRLKWHFLLLKMQPNSNSNAPWSIFLKCIKNSDWTLSIQSITEWQVAKLYFEVLKTKKD